MKNRALLLCLQNGMEYAEQYAEKIGISIDLATAILKEEAIIPNAVVERSCEVFNVSREYFLCLI